MNELDELKRIKSKYRLTNEKIASMLGVSTKMVAQWFIVPSWERLEQLRLACRDSGIPVSEWVPTAEGLPAAGEPVLVLTDSKDPTLRSQHLAVFSDGTWYLASDGPPSRYDGDIAYWTQLPELPD